MPNRQSHTLRRGRYSEAGRLYLLTTVTHQRESLFHDFQHARLVIHQLRHCEREHICHSLAWVVMPDPIHWLVELKTEPLGQAMRRFKARSSLSLHNVGLHSQRIWQAGYHDRALRREEDVVRVARYIVANPVRAGLVKSVREYPHWDAVWL
ncbi:REP-associated tyrosine transposase [Pseudomonas sp.]|uniref:REP-associated tyrosine transposase n=1 Tax=Pseudomonas sp. TaxID=306 RepID=UPI0028A70AB1|nr:transposase [Pseudomonas sp.]